MGAHIGYFAILHTWGQNLLHHPHLHCVVPGGGISVAAEKCRVRSCPNFFVHVRVLSARFSGVFLEMLRAAFKKGELEFFSSIEPLRQPSNFYRYLAPLENIDWVVHSNKPFGGPENALEYLGRYTHRVAISNQRLLSGEGGKVSFLWKDYREKNNKKRKQKAMTLSTEEFTRRASCFIRCRIGSSVFVTSAYSPTRCARSRTRVLRAATVRESVFGILQEAQSIEYLERAIEAKALGTEQGHKLLEEAKWYGERNKSYKRKLWSYCVASASAEERAQWSELANNLKSCGIDSVEARASTILEVVSTGKQSNDGPTCLVLLIVCVFIFWLYRHFH